MSQYTEGSVTLKTNSATVWGASCDWVTASNVKIGDLFKKRDQNAWYQVTAVNLATNLNISPVYAAASVSGVSYLMARDFTTNLDLPEVSAGDYDWQDAYTRAMRLIDSELFEVNVSSPNSNFTTLATHDVVLGSGSITVTLPRASERQRVYLGNRSVGTLKVLASLTDTIASAGSTVASINRTSQHDTVILVGDGGTMWYKF